MRNLIRGVAMAVLLAAAPLGSKPAQAMALPAPAALKAAAEQLNVVETVSCGYERCGYYDCGGRCSRPVYSYRSTMYYPPEFRPRYRSYYRPYYRSYGYDRPYYRSYSHYRPYYRSYNYDRPYYRPYWNSPSTQSAFGPRYRYLGRGDWYDTANVWN